MEKRALLAVVLSLAAFYISMRLFPGTPQKAAQPVQAQVSSVQAAKNISSVPSPRAVLPAATVAKEITVDTDLYTATFSSQGAGLKRLVLKKYHETAGPGANPVALVAEEGAEIPLSTECNALSLTRSSVYSVSGGNLSLIGQQSGKLEFTWVSQDGFLVKKTYNFSGNKYGIDLSIQVANSSGKNFDSSLITVLPYRLEPQEKVSRFQNAGPVIYSEDKFSAIKPAKLEKEQKGYSAAITWAGFADKYFLSAVIAQRGSIATANFQALPKHLLQASLSSPRFAVSAGNSQQLDYRLYFGPKDLDILKAQDFKLEKALDLGWFPIIAKPLLSVLKFFYGFTHNYGIAIIIITFIIKLLFVPLTHKSYSSMKEMQKLQPKMNELREKYKNDKEAMNRAIFELYRTHKVNPLGGCLPMLVQFPVFIALYNALMYSIELRHSPFVFWIHDLSAKDPYYITPLIMGGTMFIQQKMTPSSMDPAQAKVMMFLPVIFTVMFLNFPSGLVIYWLVNNVLTIAQQYYINKTLKD